MKLFAYDDSPDWLLLMEFVCKKHGHELDICLDWRELSDIDYTQYDICYFDYGYLSIDIAPVLRGIAREYPDTPLVLVTGSHREQIDEEVLKRFTYQSKARALSIFLDSWSM